MSPRGLLAACLACAGHCFRHHIQSSLHGVQRSRETEHGQPQIDGQLRLRSHLQSFTRLLIALSPAVAYTPSGPEVRFCQGASALVASHPAALVSTPRLEIGRSAASTGLRRSSLVPSMVLPKTDDAQKRDLGEEELTMTERSSEPSLFNKWYAVGYSEHLQADKPFATRLFGEPLVLYRDAEGNAVCVLDVCPHRSAPLSMGDVKGGVLRCFYHGWGFGEAGKCIDVPTFPGEKKPNLQSFCAKAYAVVERDNLLWVWRGELLTADTTKLPHQPIAGQESIFETVLDYAVDWPYLIEKSLEAPHLKSDGVSTTRTYEMPSIVRHAGADGFSEEVHIVPIAPQRTRLLLRHRLPRGHPFSAIGQLPGTLPLLKSVVRQQIYKESSKDYSALQAQTLHVDDHGLPSRQLNLASTGDELVDGFWEWLKEAVERDGMLHFTRWGPAEKVVTASAEGWQKDDSDRMGTYGLKKSYVRDHPVAEYAPMCRSDWR